MKIKRFAVSFMLLIFLFSPSVFASYVDSDIASELGLEKAEELIPDSLDSSDINFSPTNSPGENGLSISRILKTFLLYLFDSLSGEISFVFTLLAVLVISAVIFSLADPAHTTLLAALRFAVSAVVASLLISHINNAFARSEEYISELSDFMTGLLPFFGSISLVGGEIASSAVQKAILLSVITLLQNIMGNIVVPICRITASLSLVGYISGIALGSVSSFISSTATKIVTVCCGIMCTVLYFQNTVAAVSDSLALRSVKLAAGNFIPIVGSFVSEASGTLISGVRLVKSTFGVFAICVLIYMSARPILNFFVIKLSLRFLGVIADLLNCRSENKFMGEISSVYNILSAIMIATSCFFVFAIAVFIKSEVG